MAKIENEDRRLILKVSGELFSTDEEHISFPRYDEVAKQIIDIVDKTGVQLAMVVGGGNIFRGRERDANVDRNEADSMGMLATIMNGVGLREALVRNGASDARLMTALHLPELAEPYIRLKGIHHLEEHRLVVLAGGFGRPGFSTDSAVAQYASELECEMVLKASTIDGIYDSDPRKNPEAKKLLDVTYKYALQNGLEVMDATAFAMCMRTETPIFVFNIKDLHRLPEVLEGDYSFGSLVTS
jgi:uridylate kinase